MASNPPHNTPAEELTGENPLYADKRLPPHAGATGPSIRLLRPDISDAESWRLEVIPLATARRNYKALSYRWGTSNATIRCDGHDLDVTRNLQSALPYLRNAFPDKAFWIDAICINQRDNTERAHQVRIMGEIYSGAEEVLIWLEPSLLPNNAGHCFEACRRYAWEWRFWDSLTRETDPSEATDLEPINGVAIKLALEEENPFSESIMAGLLQILRQPYWLRIWVIQEMCLAKNMRARLLAEEHSLEWLDFRAFLLMVEYCMSSALREMDSNFRGLIELSRRLSHEGQTAPHLAELLVQFRWSGAKDHRDKVYGLLGLISAHDRGLITGEISDLLYEITTEDCYIHVTFELLQQTRDLSLLIHCLAPRFVTRRPDLPSWVPDWSYDTSHFPPPQPGLVNRNPYHRLSDIRPVIYSAYAASGGSRCPSPTRSGRILTLHGMIAGRITTVCRSIEIHHQYPQLERQVGILKPSVPGSWDAFSNKGLTIFWNILFLPRALRNGWMAFLVSASRKGEALDIFFEWACLARLPWNRSEDPNTEDDALTAMFTTLLRGQKGCDVFHVPFTDDGARVSIPTVTREFREFENSLPWNPVLRLLQYCRVRDRYPQLHYLALGLSYDLHRGAIQLSGLLVGPLLVLLAYLMRYGYISRWVSPDVFFWLHTLAWIFFPPRINLAKPKHLDSVLVSPLDYAMARLVDGKLALVPHCAMGGDKIALLSGASCPFVVRAAEESQWELVGDCYVNGMMEGKKWNEKEVGEMKFI